MTLKIEAGKYYRTRDGLKVGPAEEFSKAKAWRRWKVGVNTYYDNGIFSVYRENDTIDLIAEWTEEPEAARITGEGNAKGGFGMTQDQSTATHTKGPWVFDGQRVKDPNGKTVADMRYMSGRVNGSVVAAAPDMLEALRAVLRCNALPDGNPVGGGGGSSYASQFHVAGMVRAAIAKAEGRK